MKQQNFFLLALCLLTMLALGTTNTQAQSRLEIEKPSDGSNDVILNSATGNNTIFKINGQEKMRLTIDGRLGIGTTNPFRMMELYHNSSAAPIRMTSGKVEGADSYLEYKNAVSAFSNTRLALGTWGSLDGRFTVMLGNGTLNPSPKFTVLESGNVGIGTTSPEEILHLGGSNNNLKLGSYAYLGETGAGFGTILGNGVKANSGANSLVKTIPDNNDNVHWIRLQYDKGITFHGAAGGSVSQNVGFSSNEHELMRIASNGNVGIGTSSPLGKLHIVDGGLVPQRNLHDKAIAVLERNSTGYLQFLIPSSGAETGILFGKGSNNVAGGIIYNHNGLGSLQFRTFNNETSLEIASNGNVGIGTTNPSQLLHLYKSNADSWMTLETGNASRHTGLIFKRSDIAWQIYQPAGGTSLNFWNSSGTSTVMTLFSNGNVNFRGTVSSNGIALSSDARFKKDIQTLTASKVAKLDQVRGTSYQFRTKKFKNKNFSKGTQMGVIAQELMKVYPELVSKDADGYYSVNYTGLIPVLVEAVKDLRKKNSNLKNDHQAIKAELDTLTARMNALEKLLIKAKK
ncbi:hypothetical protein BKI52_35390 [marine bacterium AO1-C]|nr:hypothetical protein BKI52_35390 [marine bacterium AO1-C]